MRLRLVHAVASGFVLALALGLLLIPSLTLMVSTQPHADQSVLHRAESTGSNNTTGGPAKSAASDNLTVEGTVVSYGGRTLAETVSGQSPPTALGLSVLAVALVLVSFLLVGRFGERIPKTG